MCRTVSLRKGEKELDYVYKFFLCMKQQPVQLVQQILRDNL